MSFDSSSAVLESIRDRVEALAPSSQASPDDLFRVVIGETDNRLGNRTVRLTCQPARRVLQTNRLCDEWETQLELSVEHIDVPDEPGERGSYLRCVADAERILADLYQWSSQTDGIRRFEPELAQVVPVESTIAAVRSIAIRFRRTA